MLTDRQTASDLPHAPKKVVGLVALVLLALALFGLYALQSEATGTLGPIGFLVAFVGPRWSPATGGLRPS